MAARSASRTESCPALAAPGPIGQVGHAVPAAPVSMTFWVAHVAGTGTQTLDWAAPAGNWVIVAMNRDAAAGLTVRADAGATRPGLS
jgi:hypothetical protein